MAKKILVIMLFLSLLISISVAAEDAQEQREAFIQKAINEGIFLKAETTGAVPYLWVTPAFLKLDLEDMKKYAKVVYQYYITKNPNYIYVVLFDSKTGKKVGVYGEAYGGLRIPGVNWP